MSRMKCLSSCIVSKMTKEETRSYARFISVQVPKKADADGLIDCLGSVSQEVGISNILNKNCV